MPIRILRLLAAFALVFAPVAVLCPIQAQTIQAAPCDEDMGGQTEHAPKSAKCTIGCGMILQFESHVAVWQEFAADPFPLPVVMGTCFIGEVVTPPPK